MSNLIPYLMAFVTAFFPQFVRHHYQERETRAVLADIASTDATPHEALILANIAAHESGFRRDAKGKLGEAGAFQVLRPTMGGGAREALYRLRTQGMVGYVGCRRLEDHVVVAGVPTTCAEMVAHRTAPAALWEMAFDPPSVAPELVAGNP